jgi:hypothetical protein
VEKRFDGFYWLQMEKYIQARGNEGSVISFTSNLLPPK